MSSCRISSLITDTNHNHVVDTLTVAGISHPSLLQTQGHYAPFGMDPEYTVHEYMLPEADVFWVASGNMMHHSGVRTFTPQTPLNRPCIAAESIPDGYTQPKTSSAQPDNTAPDRVDDVVTVEQKYSATLITFILGIFPFISLLGMVFSIIGLNRSKVNGDHLNGGMLAGIGLFLALVWTIISVIVLCMLSLHISI